MYKTGTVTYTSNLALGKWRQNCSELQGQPELQKMKILPTEKKKRMWTREKHSGRQQTYNCGRPRASSPTPQETTHQQKKDGNDRHIWKDVVVYTIIPALGR